MFTLLRCKKLGSILQNGFSHIRLSWNGLYQSIYRFLLKQFEKIAVPAKTFSAHTLYYSNFSSQSDDKDIDVGMFLSMSRICYERLGLYAEGLDLSKRALNCQTSSYSKQFTSRYVVSMSYYIFKLFFMHFKASFK